MFSIINIIEFIMEKKKSLIKSVIDTFLCVAEYELIMNFLLQPNDDNRLADLSKMLSTSGDYVIAGIKSITDDDEYIKLCNFIEFLGDQSRVEIFKTCGYTLLSHVKSNNKDAYERLNELFMLSINATLNV